MNLWEPSHIFVKFFPRATVLLAFSEGPLIYWRPVSHLWLRFLLRYEMCRNEIQLYLIYLDFYSLLTHRFQSRKHWNHYKKHQSEDLHQIFFLESLELLQFYGRIRPSGQSNDADSFGMAICCVCPTVGTHFKFKCESNSWKLNGKSWIWRHFSNFKYWMALEILVNMKRDMDNNSVACTQ